MAPIRFCSERINENLNKNDNKKIVNRDGEGEPNLSETSIKNLKKRKITYKTANTELAVELEIDSDALVVPIVCKKIDPDILLE